MPCGLHKAPTYVYYKTSLEKMLYVTGQEGWAFRSKVLAQLKFCGVKWYSFFEARTMDKLTLTWWNLGQVINSRLGHVCICNGIEYITKWSNLKLETRPKQLLGSLLSALVLPAMTYSSWLKGIIYTFKDTAVVSRFLLNFHQLFRTEPKP